MGSIKVGVDPRLPALQTQPGFWERFRGRLWDVLRDLSIAVNEHIHVVRQKSYAPTTLTVTAGTLDSGTVADLAAPGGTTVNVSEVAATPGFNVEVVFSNVANPLEFSLIGYYAGDPAHVVTVDAWNYTTSAWDNYGTMASTSAAEFKAFSFVRGADYVSAGAAKFRFYHVTAGVGTHDLYLDYCAILSLETV